MSDNRPIDTILLSDAELRHRHITDADNCPRCDVTWAYDQDGKRYSRVVGMVEADRIAYWCCPNCGTQWERNATAEGGTQ